MTTSGEEATDERKEKAVDTLGRIIAAVPNCSGISKETAAEAAAVFRWPANSQDLWLEPILLAQ
jgi:hypothetical protein